jgi:hypothetical protein
MRVKKLKGLTFAAVIALSLLASTTTTFAKDAKHDRGTAWTDVGLPRSAHDSGSISAEGVTWE